MATNLLLSYRTLNDAIVLTLDEMTQEQNIDNDKDNEIDSNDNPQSTPNKPSDATSVALSSLIVISLSTLLVKML